jgi:hypothetical protein
MMTVTDKIVVYLCSLFLFLCWETMFVAQLFRGEFIAVSIAMLIFGLVCFLHIVRVIRSEPLEG